jgi:predicted transcriptional regulator
VTNEHRPNTIVKILETALAGSGASVIKLFDKSHLTEYPDKLKMYLSILENNGLLAYHKGDGIYRTTYKGMHFLRMYNRTIDLLTNLEKEYNSLYTFVQRD